MKWDGGNLYLVVNKSGAKRMGASGAAWRHQGSEGRCVRAGLEPFLRLQNLHVLAQNCNIQGYFARHHGVGASHTGGP